MSEHVGEKCGKLSISYIISSKRGITPSRIDENWRHLNLICSIIKQCRIQNFNSIGQSIIIGEKCGKLCISNILSSKKGITPTKIDVNWRHSNLICCTVTQSHMQNFGSICQACRRKVRKTAYFLYSKFKKRDNSFNIWRKVTTLKLDL